MNEELNRLLMLLEATYQQIAMVKFDLRGEEKRSLQTLDTQIERKIKGIRGKMSTKENEYFDLMGIVFLEALREVHRCADPKLAVAMLQALNEGLEINIDGRTIRDYNPPGKYQPPDQKVA